MANEPISRISEEKAALVLDRAAKIDAGHGRWLDVAELRDAALEAGISLEAFERALAEVERMTEAAAVTPAAETESRVTLAEPSRAATLAGRSAMLAGGFLIGGLALLLSGPFGLDDAGIAFALLIALAAVIGSVVRHARRRDILDFEIDLALLWVGLTFVLMFTGSPENVLSTMGVLGGLTALGGGALVAMTGAVRPKELPDRT
jgi:hypothetical protein